MVGTVHVVVYCMKQSQTTVGKAASVYEEISPALWEEMTKCPTFGLLPKVQPDEDRRIPAWPAASSFPTLGVVWGYLAVALRQSWVPGLNVVGPEEACECSEALMGFALSPVPTRGETGQLLDEGFEHLVCCMCLPPTLDPQGAVLVPGVQCCFLCEAVSLSPASMHLSLLTCHLIWLTPREGDNRVLPLPCLPCWQ